LRLNVDLAEAIALAHDLGHPPFGHKGETALNELMKDHGGFEHNQHSLRIVELLERKYPGFEGLNLTWETREGLVKHFTAYDHPGKREGFDARNASLEAQVANLSDEIAYYSHDLDDGLDSNLLSEMELRKNVGIWSNASRSVKRKHGDLPEESRRYFTIRCIIDMQVKDVVRNAELAIAESGVKSSDEVRLQERGLVNYSEKRRLQNLEMRDYLYENLYYNPEVHEPNLRGISMLKDLFHHCLKHRKEIGEQNRKRARKIGWHRAVCDYLAGMTDLHVQREHRRIFGQ